MSNLKSVEEYAEELSAIFANYMSSKDAAHASDIIVNMIYSGIDDHEEYMHKEYGDDYPGY